MVSRAITSQSVTVAVVVGSAIVVLLLLLFNVIPSLLAFPIFLLPISLYLVIMAAGNVSSEKMTHTYYLVWSGVAMAILVPWLTVYIFPNLVLALVEVLVIFLVYYYLNRFLSSAESSISK